MTTRTTSSLLSLLLILSACSDEPQAPQPEVDVGADVSEADTFRNRDIEEDLSCFERAEVGTIIDLVPDRDSTQIHPYVVFDGEALWVTYSEPDAVHTFDVFATRLRCDGEVLVAPFKLNVAVDENDLDSAVAVADDRALFVWSSDNSQGPYNMDVYVRLFQTDGTPLWEEERQFEGILEGSFNPGTVWEPEVVGYPLGFVLAGAWGVQFDVDSGLFQVFTQRLDLDGANVGEVIEVNRNEEYGQLDPAIAIAPDGTLAVAWAESNVDVADRLVSRRFGPDDRPLAPAGEVSPGTEGTRVAVAHAPDGQFLFALSNDDSAASDIHLLDHEGNLLRTLDSGGLDHSPSLAVDSSGNVGVVWFRLVQGFRNRLYMAPAEGDPLRIDTEEKAAPYESTVTAIGDGLFFTVWAEGESPNFRLKGLFFRP